MVEEPTSKTMVVPQSLLNFLMMLSFIVYCSGIHGQSRAASTPQKVTVAYAAISPIMAGVWMAKEIGAYEKYGLQADLVFDNSIIESIKQQGFIEKLYR